MNDDPESNSPSPFSGRVLVVEDEEVNRIVARGIMIHLGIDPDFAETGYEALDKITRQEYDLVFMDVQMSGMDGTEATAQIRDLERTQGRRRTPIIALTAFTADGDRDRCIKAGMDDFLAKPLMRESLVDTFKRWLGTDTNLGESDKGSDHSQVLMGDEPVDRDRLLTLERSMSTVPGGLKRVLESYLESLVRLPETIREAEENEDTDSLARAAHALKSNSAAAGALTLSALCSELEQAARNGDLGGSGELFLRIINETDRVKVAIERELNEASA